MYLQVGTNKGNISYVPANRPQITYNKRVNKQHLPGSSMKQLRRLGAFLKNQPLVLWAVAAVVAYVGFSYFKFDIYLLVMSEARRAAVFSSFGTQFSDLITLTLSILVEALPFVVLGVLISVVIQTGLPTERLIKKLPKNAIARRAIVSFLGVFMPVCECGNVPVARGLLAKGLSVQESIVFLLAAPSVNIITFIVTWEVFSQNHGVAIVRVLATIGIANVAALIVSRALAPQAILTKAFAAYCKEGRREGRGLRGALTLFRSEMWLITRLLVIGALIAAASQIFIPREFMDVIGSNGVLSVLAMLALAFVISICSSVDAFFALAYVNVFGLGPIIAFLVAGPMVDIKMIALMKSTFTYRAIAIIAATVLVLSFIVGLGASYVW